LPCNTGFFGFACFFDFVDVDVFVGVVVVVVVVVDVELPGAAAPPLEFAACADRRPCAFANSDARG
jgi:hypothetical protein